MSRGIIYLIIAIVNFVLFMLHRKLYRANENTRKSWAIATIAFPFGISLAAWEVWLDKDPSGFWGMLVILISGIIMLFLNREKEGNKK
jgi:hypothetical protein